MLHSKLKQSNSPTPKTLRTPLVSQGIHINRHASKAPMKGALSEHLAKNIQHLMRGMSLSRRLQNEIVTPMSEVLLFTNPCTLCVFLSRSL